MTQAARVVAVSGHMVDAPDRPTVRFPPDEVDRVTAEVSAALDDWGVGPGTTVVSGGARGADLIVAESAQQRGAGVVLCLALPPDEFERRSVELPGSDWSARFRQLLDVADVRVLQDDREGAADPAGDGTATDPGEDVFARANAWMVHVARSLAEGTPHALVVWNGQAGDGPGGTRDFVTRLGHDRPGPRVRVIDPTPRAYQVRQRRSGPKRLLALDGGGIRGVISLHALRTMEAQLRTRAGGDLVLADYFDYIAGTSTGAIIATGLSLGMSVSELQRYYLELAGKVFTRRWMPMRMRSLYRDGPLTTQLETIFGPGRTLGDAELRSLLLIVLHNTVTDSVWPLSNCTVGKYNRADRYLLTTPDRNLDLPLTTIVRGSTAAPVYFSPQQLAVGEHRFVFQDGGLTPFNNPALLLFLMATLPEYGLEWEVGEDRLLLVSVGTGSSAAVHPGLLARQVNLIFNARNLPGVFMNGAAVGQDLICRSLGRCRAGMPIDREFGDRLDARGVAGNNLFTYVRYDADLSDAGLAELGIGARRDQAAVRKLDAVDALPQLQRVGAALEAAVDVDRHFVGFL